MPKNQKPPKFCARYNPATDRLHKETIMQKSKMNKRDCVLLLQSLGQHKNYYIASMNGIDRFIGPDKMARVIKSWDELYTTINTFPNLRIPKEAVNPKGLTDEQIAELAK
jgi:hypothetical protein